MTSGFSVLSETITGLSAEDLDTLRQTFQTELEAKAVQTYHTPQPQFSVSFLAGSDGSHLLAGSDGSALAPVPPSFRINPDALSAQLITWENNELQTYRGVYQDGHFYSGQSPPADQSRAYILTPTPDNLPQVVKGRLRAETESEDNPDRETEEVLLKKSAFYPLKNSLSEPIVAAIINYIFAENLAKRSTEEREALIKQRGGEIIEKFVEGNPPKTEEPTEKIQWLDNLIREYMYLKQISDPQQQESMFPGISQDLQALDQFWQSGQATEKSWHKQWNALLEKYPGYREYIG